MASAARPGRIDGGGLLAAAGAVLLLVSLFLDWYEPGVTAWTVFEALDLVLAAAAVTVLAFAARSFSRSPVGERAAAAAAVVAFVVVVSQLLDKPPAALEQGIEIGAWLALAGAALMLVGTLMSRAGMSLAVVVERPAAADGAETAPLPREEPR